MWALRPVATSLELVGGHDSRKIFLLHHSRPRLGNTPTPTMPPAAGLFSGLKKGEQAYRNRLRAAGSALADVGGGAGKCVSPLKKT